MNKFDLEISCEEFFKEENELVFVSRKDLPNASYLGNNEWLGIDNKHYIVED